MDKKTAIKSTEEQMKKTIHAVERELSELRTGRANPKMVEGLHVNYYGAPTMLKDMATISVPEARMIVIQPWDQTAIPEIEKAVLASNLGITPSNDGKLIRLIVPPLSGDRRDEMVRMVKKIVEEGKVSIRTVRKDANERVKQLEKEKKITEDDRFQVLEEIQKMTDRYVKDLDKHLEDKEKELREV